MRSTPRRCRSTATRTLGFRFVPAAPHFQALNRAESTWGRIHGGAYLNARRARIRLGPHGALHGLPAQPHAGALCAGPLVAPMHAVGGAHPGDLRRVDHARLRGPVGLQHRADGKANAHRTPTGPALYLHPATSPHAQLVFNMRSIKVMVVGSLAHTVNPYEGAIALLLTLLLLFAQCKTHYGD